MEKRRTFIKKTVVGAAGLTLGSVGFSAKSYASIRGANDRLNVAVIGLRSRGEVHVDVLAELKNSHNVEIKALCDVDERILAERAQRVEKLTNTKPITEWDMRKIFENKDIDAVSFATPNHWHALGTIWACQAGKHVYVEKPASHNIWEGRKMVEAARKYSRCVQVGFQNRAIANVVEAIKFIHEGNIGDVYMARGLCINPRDSFGIAADSQPPVALHYDQWLGPATYRTYNERKVHYNWHWFWDTGNGDTGNQGPHQFDIARWGLNKQEHPVSIYSTGGLFGINPKECAQETPNTQTSVLKYEDGTVLEFETRGRFSNKEANLNIDVGNIFYGTKGYLELSGNTWKAYRERETVPFAESQQLKTESASATHSGSRSPAIWINFVDAVRSGGAKRLVSDIEQGHYSTALPLLANISYRLGRSLTFMKDDEKFANDTEANTLLKRKYRIPYVIPDIV